MQRIDPNLFKAYNSHRQSFDRDDGDPTPYVNDDERDNIENWERMKALVKNDAPGFAVQAAASPGMKKTFSIPAKSGRQSNLSNN